MTGRWIVKVLAVDGGTVHMEVFVFRARARAFARRMRSPLYDIDLVDGRDRRPAERLSTHAEPAKLLAAIAEAKRVWDDPKWADETKAEFVAEAENVLAFDFRKVGEGRTNGCSESRPASPSAFPFERPE